MILLFTGINNTPVRISADSVESYTKQETCTFLRSKTGYNYSVKESPESIDKALIEAYTYIKKVADTDKYANIYEGKEK